MNLKSFKYLVISRYVTYIAVFIMSLTTSGNSLENNVQFSFLFAVVLINSSVRVRRLLDNSLLFTLSILFEIPIIVLMQRGFNTSAMAYLYIIVVEAYLFFEIRKAVLFNVILYAALLIGMLPNSGTIDWADIGMNFFANAVMMLFFAAASYSIKREQMRKQEIQKLYDELKISKEELQDANRKLQDYAEKIEEISVLNERNRLAGEIHDTIGHKLTGLIMELDICGKLISKDIEVTREELAKASQLARDTLSEVRKSVREIMPTNMEGMTGINSIKELIREFEKNSRINVVFTVSEYRYKLTPTVEVTLYRTIQESLTNCAKYGQATKVLINLNFKEGSLMLYIEDNGNGCSEFMKGVGLSTMEERIHSLGGRIEINGEQGFKIDVVIPVEV
ncbi:MAG: sensor histidine kinase [Bacillota bacterium]|nr:sensor histidine kinase [Bacillota bacterium]